MATEKKDEDLKTATCYCGAVQLAFSLEGDNFIGSFICHCTDDRKITSSMHATNFILKNDTLTHVRGREKLSQFTMGPPTIVSGHDMTNNFCSVCGSLMYRVSSGFPGKTILRVGQVDDLSLHETTLRPTIEQFGKDRVAWLPKGGVEGVKQVAAGYYQ